MRIGIDISSIVYGTGVSIYTRELVRNLLLLDPNDSYILFGGSLRRLSDLKNATTSFKGNVETRFLPFPPTLAHLVWNKLHTLPVEVFTGDIDVFHSSDWTQPPSKAFKVTTVHDLAPIRYPRETHPRIVMTHKDRLSWVKKEVDRVIVPSTATKNDLVDFGIADDKIVVIPEAPSIVGSKPTEREMESVRKKYRIDSKYIVTVGVGRRKNTERLIKAFELARAGEELKLVLIGRKSEKYKEGRGLRFTGHVSDKQFSDLIWGAEALVYPSIYEGFGLPVLEAFKAGVPVVTSNVSSLPEVAGDAAILVDPYEIDSIANGIRQVLRQKKTWSEKGTKKVQEFSWEKTASETLKVYKEALKNG